MPFEIPTGDDLRRYRLSLKLTQAEVARRAGVSQPLIARIERGSVDPRLSTLTSIVRALSRAERDEVKLREVMKTPVVAVKAGDTILKAVEIMRENNFSQLPVVQKGVPVGSVSERSVIERLHATRNPEELGRTTVQEIMGPAFPIVPPEETLDAVYGLLEENPAVAVMERGRLVGLVTKADLLRLIGRRIPPAPAPVR